MEVASRDTSYLSICHFFLIHSLPTSLDTMPYILYVSGEEKAGERNGRVAKLLRVAEMVGDVVSRV